MKTLDFGYGRHKLGEGQKYINVKKKARNNANSLYVSPNTRLYDLPLSAKNQFTKAIYSGILRDSVFQTIADKTLETHYQILSK